MPAADYRIKVTDGLTPPPPLWSSIGGPEQLISVLWRILGNEEIGGGRSCFQILTLRVHKGWIGRILSHPPFHHCKVDVVANVVGECDGPESDDVTSERTSAMDSGRCRLHSPQEYGDVGSFSPRTNAASRAILLVGGKGGSRFSRVVTGPIGCPAPSIIAVSMSSAVASPRA